MRTSYGDVVSDSLVSYCLSDRPWVLALCKISLANTPGLTLSLSEGDRDFRCGVLDDVTFDVTEAFRGVQPGRVDVLAPKESFFEVGFEYLVYATKLNGPCV